jgi:O-antigen ligase
MSGKEADLEGNSVDATFLLVLIIIGLRILYVRRFNIKRIIKNNKALFIFYGFALLSLLWVDSPLIGFKRWTKWSGSLVMVLLILSEENYKAAINSLIKRCAYALIPLSIIFNKFIPNMGRSYSRGGGPDYHGVSTQKNEYAALLLICGIYLAWELIVSLRRKDYTALKEIGYINTIFLVVIFWQLFFIDSKTSIICLMVGIGVIFWLGHPYFKGFPLKALKYIVAFAIAAIFLQQVIDIKSRIISSAGRNPTLTTRTLLWADILELPINPWVGTGWDTFWSGDKVTLLWEKRGWSPRSAHNGYLEIYISLGWAGIVLLFFVLLGAFRNSAASLITDFEYGCLSLSFFIILLFYNYSESAFHRTSAIWFFSMLFCCISIPKKNIGIEPIRRDSFS